MSGIHRDGRPRGIAARAADPPLIAAVHGTTDPAGAAAVSSLIAQVKGLRPGIEISAAFLSKGTPALADALAVAAARGRKPIVVPLLLSSGFHVRHDIPRAAAAAGASVAAHLGPDPLLIEVLAERVLPLLRSRPGARVVLAAAGSRDPRAAEEARRATELLASRLGCAVTSAFVTTTAPALHAVLGDEDEDEDVSRPTIVATYLLAPGEFERRVRRAANGMASAPLAPHPFLAKLILRRYDAVRSAEHVIEHVGILRSAA